MNQRITRGSGRELLHISFEYDLLESSSIAWEIPSVITSVKPNITVFISPLALWEIKCCVQLNFILPQMEKHVINKLHTTYGNLSVSRLVDDIYLKGLVHYGSVALLVVVLHLVH